MKNKLILFLVLLFCSSEHITTHAQMMQSAALQTEEVVLLDSIESLTHALDSVKSLQQKLNSDYVKIKEQVTNSGTLVDSLLEVNALQSSELYALQLTNDSLNARIQALMAEREVLIGYVDSLMALQEHKQQEFVDMKRWARTSWFNLSYSLQKMNSDLYRTELQPDYAFGVTFGRTYYLHKKPLANMIRFALNWSYLDLNIAQYSIPYSDRIDEDGSSSITDGVYGNSSEIYKVGNRIPGFIEDIYDDDEEGNTDSQYKIEAGMQFGPSIWVNPIGDLMIQAYFHYSPTFSILLDDELSYYSSYASFFNSGVTLSYKVIGFGLEARWGSSTFSQEVYNEELGDYESQNMKWRTKGMRVFLSFRF